eukprot:TRINITY_DN25417_c0_g1_i1.p1 TRINITY_DN25417_c0_g1~~TRINITY_DN25417_c0_g1_i1.p1  ORF type:complete len:943 (-),score=150.67 TRINITY_DN25417_c0_g1_i1:49-2877(-)
MINMQQLLSAVSTALPISLMSLASALSYAQLLSASANSVLSPDLIAASAFLSIALTTFTVSATSHCAFQFCMPDMTIVLFLSKMLERVSASDLDDEAKQATAMLALRTGSVFLGLVYFTLGWTKATVAFSYLPYPVIAGFLAMIGVAVMKGALNILWPAEGQSFAPVVIASLITGTSLGLRNGGVPSNISSVVIIFASIAIFYGAAWLQGFSMDDLRSWGWLLPASGKSLGGLAVFDAAWGSVDVSLAIPDQEALSLVLVSCISRALTISAVESTIAVSPFSVDSEMVRAGISTIAASAVGGVAMNPTTGQTGLNKEGSRGDEFTGRLTGFIGGLVYFLVWASGFPITMYLPKFLLCGLLMNVGAGMAFDWAWVVNRKLQWQSIGIIYSMLLIWYYLGLFPGIAAGVLIAFFLITIRFSQLQVLKYHVSGLHFRSGEIYSQKQRNMLRLMGSRIQIVGVTGFIFEGVAISFTKYLTNLINAHDELQALVLDFFACQGINDSACAHLGKVFALCVSNNIQLMLCNLSPEDAQSIKSWGILPGDCTMHASVASALSAAEHTILEESGAPALCPEGPTPGSGTERQMLEEWLGEDVTNELLELAEFSIVPKGKILCKQGDEADAIYVAVPRFSDVSCEMATGATGRTATLLRTSAGAVCAPETLIRSKCRETWQARDESIVIRLEIEQCEKLKVGLATLLAIGLKQQCYEKEQLSSSYTVRSGGGWLGATFDSETGSKSALGMQLAKTPARSVAKRQTSLEVSADTEGWNWQSIFSSSSGPAVAAVLSRRTSAGSEHDNFENLLLNRDTIRFRPDQQGQSDGLESLFPKKRQETAPAKLVRIVSEEPRDSKDDDDPELYRQKSRGTVPKLEALFESMPESSPLSRAGTKIDRLVSEDPQTQSGTKSGHSSLAASPVKKPAAPKNRLDALFMDLEQPLLSGGGDSQ